MIARSSSHVSLLLRSYGDLANSAKVPARNAVEWGTRRFETNIIDNPFSGEPRPELERAWHELLRSKVPFNVQ